MANTTPDIVSVVMLKPNTARAPNVPRSTTGTVISVSRTFCRNTNMTMKTSAMASTSVLITSSMERLTNARAANQRVNRWVNHLFEVMPPLRTALVFRYT
jgi:hypothetical protein